MRVAQRRGRPRLLAAIAAATVVALAMVPLAKPPVDALNGAEAPHSGVNAQAAVRALALAQAPSLRVGDGATDTWQVAPGSFVTVPIEVANVSNLAAATFRLDYDPAAVEPVGCVKPVGASHDGFCNLNFGLGSLKANAIAAQGITGTRRLWEVRFEGVGDGVTITRTDLAAIVESAADAQGDPQALTATGGAIELSGTGGGGDVVRAGGPGGAALDLVAGESVAVSVTLGIVGPAKLAVASLLLRYDPAVVRPLSCAKVTPGGGGSPPSGFCNPFFDPAAGLIKLNLLDPNGLSGELHPYDLRFEAAPSASAGATSNLVPIVDHAEDEQGQVLRLRPVPGRITILSGSPTSPIVRIDGPGTSGQLTATIGSTLTVPVWVDDGVDLGAATVEVLFDPEILRPVGCIVRSDLTPAISGGGCAPRTDRYRAGILSNDGIDGDTRLFDMSFTPLPGAQPGAVSALSVRVTNYADAQGTGQPYRTRDGSATIAGGSLGTAATLRIGTSGGGSAFEIAQGGRVDVPVRVEGAAGLGAATVRLRWDPEVIVPVRCVPGDGAFDGRFCNAFVAANEARVNAVSVAGFSGDATLVTATFRAADTAAVGATSPLSITASTFDSPAGAPLPYQVVAGSVAITGGIGTVVQAELTVGGSYTVTNGAEVTVPITAVVDNGLAPAGIGAGTFELAFDPDLIDALTCTINDDIGGANGFEGGFCNVDYAAGRVRFNVLSGAGVGGTTRLAEVRYRADNVFGGTSPLTLIVRNLSDAAGDPMTHRATHSALEVPPTITRTPTPSAVPTNTATPTPGGAPTATLTPGPSATPTETPTSTATATSTSTPVPTATNTATPAPSATNTSIPPPTATATNTPTPTVTPVATATGLVQHTFSVDADSFVHEFAPTTNLGGSASLRTDGSPIDNTYIRFDVTGITGAVQSAKLRVFALDSATGGVSVHESADTTWGEMTITYNNAPSFGGSLATSGAVSSYTWVELDVTAVITGNGLVTLVVTGDDNTRVRYNAKEAPTNRPQLVVETGGGGGGTATSTLTPAPTSTFTATSPVATATPTATGLVEHTFNVDADSFVHEFAPTTNLGGSASLRTDGSPIDNTYIRFDVTGLSGSVQSAKVRVFALDAATGGVSAHESSDTTWGEMTITYNNAPSFGGSLASSGAISAYSWVEIDVTSAITGNGLVTLVLTGDDNTRVRYNAKEAPTNRPRLVVETSGGGGGATATAMATPASTATPTATSLPSPTLAATPTGLVESSFSVDADSFVHEFAPTTNLGGSASLRTDGSPIDNTYIRFDVTGITGTVHSATLRVFALDSATAGIALHESADTTWGEMTITYNNAPSFGGSIASSGAISSYSWVELDATSAITGNGLVTFVLAGNDTTRVRHNSKEAPTNRPQLVIQTQ